MPQTNFDQLPDDSRLWVFPVQEPLDPTEQDALSAAVSGFLDGWAAHGTPLTGAFTWTADRFLLVAVDQASVPPSGCSIDSMVRVLKGMEATLGKGIVDHSRVYYRDESGQVRQADRASFKAAARQGEVSSDTLVFDTTITSLGALRSGKLEVPARSSWHGSVFF